MISILDTVTSRDYIVWTSSPHDPSISDTTIYNPTASPMVTTKYKVKVYNLLGNIFRDSITIKRNPIPVPGLFKDSTICRGRQVVLTAHGGNTFHWSTGDTVASITVHPVITTKYWVLVTNQWNCSASDTTNITVENIPVVTIHGLLPKYCTSDSCAVMSGTPSSPGTYSFGGSPGVSDSLFCPGRARIGRDTAWYRYTNLAGCTNSDTAFITINQPLVIPLKPDTSVCADKYIILNAGPGADTYLWSTGSHEQTIIVDTVSHGLGLLQVWVYATKGSCVSKDTTNITFVNCTGIGEKKPGGLLTLYPNPFNQDITIEIHDQPGTADRAEILDSRGEIITAKPVISKITRFQTKTFPSGIYFIRLVHNSARYYFKAVKM
jgi:hypothetical protein